MSVPSSPVDVDTSPPSPADNTVSTLGLTQRGQSPVLVVLCASWLVICASLAVLADLLPLDPPDVDAGVRSRLPPFETWSAPLGTDSFGRNVMSRLIFGARISLSIGALASVLGAILGGAIGLIAGYFRGGVDAAIGLVTDALLAFPALVLLVALAATMGPGFPTIILGLTAVSLPSFIRLSRANALRVMQNDFIVASRALGARARRIILLDVVPNVLLPVAAFALVMTAVLIIAESSLTFLGLGLRPPASSWGVMVEEGRGDLRDHAHLVFVPAAALFLTVFSLNVVGEHARARAGSQATRVR